MPEQVDTAKVAIDLAMVMIRLRSRLRSESAAEMTGWSLSQLSTLARIIRDGPMTASAVAKAEYLRPPSIAENLSVLKTAGLVRAKPDPTDGRKILLTATAKGRRLADAVAGSREAWLARAIDAALEPAEAATLASAITLMDRLADCDLSAGPPGWH